MRRSAAALLAATLLAGCAPAAQLRVPAYTGPAIESGRLLVLRAAPVDASNEAVESAQTEDQQGYEDVVWRSLERALRETYRFSEVRVDALPEASALVPVFTSRQVVHEGRAENRWLRRTVNLPAAPVADVPAEYVLVLDTVRVTRRIGEESGFPKPRDIAVSAAASAVLAPLTGFIVVPTSRIVRGTFIRAPYALYRVGEPVPLAVGELEGFAGGGDGVDERSALARSLERLAADLSDSGAVRPR